MIADVETHIKRSLQGNLRGRMETVTGEKLSHLAETAPVTRDRKGMTEIASRGLPGRVERGLVRRKTRMLLPERTETKK